MIYFCNFYVYLKVPHGTILQFSLKGSSLLEWMHYFFITRVWYTQKHIDVYHLAVIDAQTNALLSEVHVRETIRDVSFLHDFTMYAVAQRKYVYIDKIII